MNRYKSFLLILGILCAILVGISFMIAGTPVSQQAVSLDQIRLSNFNEIKLRIDEYYRKNAALPQSLQELEKIQQSIKIRLMDPETDTQYTYNVLSGTTYELCATFSTDSSEYDGQAYVYSETDTSHVKGYDCITYSISPYLLTPTPYLMPKN